jgi:hypothetical protein
MLRLAPLLLVPLLLPNLTTSSLLNPSPPCLAELRDMAVLPGDPLYNVSQRVNNPLWNRILPPFVALPQTADDVQRALQCAAANGLEVAVKGGGHGFGGYSAVGSNGAFVIAFTNMTRVTVASSGANPSTVTASAGARWGDVYAALANTSSVVVGGLCPTVGVAGYVQGGGVGALSRAHGLAADNLLAATLVTANGSDVVSVTATSHPDLFFALRGSGGGNFGVLVDVTLAAHPAPPALTWSLLCYPPSAAPQVFSAAAGAFLSFPSWASVDVVASPPTNATSNDGSVCVWSIVQADQATSNRTLGPFLENEALAPLLLANASLVRSYSTFLEMTLEYAAAHGYSEFDDTPYASKNCLVMEEVLKSGGGPGVVANATSAAFAALPPSCSLHWIAFGGHLGAVPANETAFPWRDAALMIYAACGFTDARSYTLSDAYLNDFKRIYTAPACAPHNASYVNFLDPTQTAPGWGEQYYMGNLPRLMAVKEAWAPAGRTPLRFAQEIGPGAQALPAV